MTDLLNKPTDVGSVSPPGKFDKFNLKENPFPSQPFINKDASDKRINGKIFEMEIRIKEYQQIESNFLKVSQTDASHLRLAYIIDTSYVGRGNGKSAFLVNLLDRINKYFCLDISHGLNKCFAIYLTPELGGRTKTFDKFIDLFFNAIAQSNLINTSLAIMRLEALLELKPKHPLGKANDADVIEKLNSERWFVDGKININDLTNRILKNKYLQDLPDDFPLFRERSSIFKKLINQQDFIDYYLDLHRTTPKLEFVFSNLVNFFRAANFNGAYVFVDDFERVPDFQSARQKRDFALELRSCLFDGPYVNSKVGFYNLFLVLHAGVPRLIQEAWSDSGMENRSPISPTPSLPRHIIPFEKLTRDHAKLLIKKYLSEYRIQAQKKDELFPFTEGAVFAISQLSENNASKMLKMAFDILDRAAQLPGQKMIDAKFISSLDDKKVFEEKPGKIITSAETADLLKKAKTKGKS